jgi:hypothetical protein
MDTTTSAGFYTSVAVDPRNGTAYVAYVDNNNFLRVSKLDPTAGASANGTVIVSIQDYVVNAVKLAFYVDPITGQGHLYVCYGIASPGGVLVKDFVR